MAKAQGEGPLLLGDRWALWDWGCKGIGSSIIKDAEKVVGCCVLLHMVYTVIKARWAAQKNIGAPL